MARERKLVFPSTRHEAIEVFRKSSIPQIRLPKTRKGLPQPAGTRLRKHGMTPEERLAQYAPASSSTIPERMVFGWLKTHNFMFTFQDPVMGGRVPGGAVVDFIVYDKTPPVVIRIMSYWHKSTAVQTGDDIQMEMLISLGYQVEDVWEVEVSTVERVDEKMRQVFYGAPKIGTTILTAEG